MKPRIIAENTKSRFRKRKVMTIEQLIALIKASRRTVQRRLEEWKVVNSYNQNGRYYTLPDVPAFDSFGIWRFHLALFSKYGNLTQTVLGMVKDSEAGLAANELTVRLGLNVDSFMSRFAEHPQIAREKVGGRFLYFAADSARRESQLRGRHDLHRKPDPPSPTQVVAILVEAIKHPQSDMEALAAILRRKGESVSAPQIQDLFQLHGLVLKKTSPSGSCES
jgi:hypothetical protein